MTHRGPVPAADGRRPLVALVTVTGLALATLGCQAASPAPAPASAPPSSVEAPTTGSGGSLELDGPPSEGDGLLPDGSTVFDEHLPGIANLDPDLLRALREATVDAAERGIEIQVRSGWRSAAYQHHLWQQALVEYGSEAEAARWVATAERSSHVTGRAVDITPYDAIDWLARRGAAYGLCQIYGNESWHYELRPDAADSGCPEMYLDPTHEPTTQP